MDENIKRAMEQGQAQFDSIRELVEALHLAEQGENDRQGSELDDARTRIEEDALCIEVRSDWYAPGSFEDSKPAQYQILLCTGGPACRIIGELSMHSEPETAVMEVQDWGTPWTPFRPIPFDVAGENGETVESILLAYASVFWFGE